MSRKEFGFLLQQYLEGKCTEEERQFVEHWFAVIQNEDQEAGMHDLQDLEPAMWKKISARTGTAPQTVSKNLKTRAWRWAGGIAAAFLLLLLTTSYFERQRLNDIPKKAISQTDAAWLTKRNEGIKSVEITLPDESTVILEPGSQLTYPHQFGDSERVVSLKGEAFFEIAKNRDKPFFVYTEKIVTKVLGTSFYIRSKPEKPSSVEVVSGRVAVYQKQKRNSDYSEQTEEIILSSNQKALYVEERHKLVTSLVDNPQVIPADAFETPPSFVFEDAPVRDVLHQLSSAYGISIVLTNPMLDECPLTADLSNLTLYQKLDMVCAATNSNYVIAGTSITVNGDGCDNLQ